MKKVIKFETDLEAELFLEQDLSGLDFSAFKPMKFEIEKKSSSLNMRIPKTLLDAIREKAKLKGIPYARYVRMVLEEDLQRG